MTFWGIVGENFNLEKWTPSKSISTETRRLVQNRSLVRNRMKTRTV